MPCVLAMCSPLPAPPAQPSGQFLVFERQRVERLLSDEFQYRLRDLSNEQLVELLDQLLRSKQITAPSLLSEALMLGGQGGAAAPLAAAQAPAGAAQRAALPELRWPFNMPFSQQGQQQPPPQLPLQLLQQQQAQEQPLPQQAAPQRQEAAGTSDADANPFLGSWLPWAREPVEPNSSADGSQPSSSSAATQPSAADADAGDSSLVDSGGSALEKLSAPLRPFMKAADSLSLSLGVSGDSSTSTSTSMNNSSSTSTTGSSNNVLDNTSSATSIKLGDRELPVPRQLNKQPDVPKQTRLQPEPASSNAAASSTQANSNSSSSGDSDNTTSTMDSPTTSASKPPDAAAPQEPSAAPSQGAMQATAPPAAAPPSPSTPTVTPSADLEADLGEQDLTGNLLGGLFNSTQADKDTSSDQQPSSSTGNSPTAAATIESKQQQQPSWLPQLPSLPKLPNGAALVTPLAGAKDAVGEWAADAR